MLDPAELHHLLHVLRLGEGEAVELFDGLGRVASAVIRRAGKRDVTLAVGEVRDDARGEPAGPLRLVTALPKGKRLDWLLEKAVELGATHLRPLESDRTVRHAPLRRRGEGGGRADESGTGDGAGVAEGWSEASRRACIESAKQCRRNRLPVLEPACRVADLAADRTVSDPGEARVFGRPGAPSLPSWAARHGRPSALTILVGPEGGLTPAEEAGLEAAGWSAVGLGAAVLRIETACVAGLAVGATVLAGAG